MLPAAQLASPASAVLHEVFGHDKFRFGQRKAVDAVISGRDAMVLLPTGGGKSLCYQVPAVAMHRAGRGTTIVVSPLIALMQDQVSALTGRGCAAAALNSHQDEDEQRSVVASFLRNELELLYVSPERAAMPGFRRLLKRVEVALIAIDEAHCVSQWGHDFRPEYLRLGELREHAKAPVIALTATATPRVMDEIAEKLALAEPTIVRGDFRRPGLRFSVRHLRSDAARLEAILRALSTANLGKSSTSGRAIIYCSTRKKTETVAKALKSAGLKAGYYHAGRTKLARERAQRAFDLGRCHILVATNAFGMGIDYPNVRLLVHFQAPGSLEAYYQEAGRAGRDGLPAECLLLFGPGDLVTQRRLKSSQSGKARTDEALRAIEGYASELVCRQVMLCAHFTGSMEHAKCGGCDVCTDSDAVADALAEQAPRFASIELLGEAERSIIVDAVGQLPRPAGKTNLAKALRGSRSKAMNRGGLRKLPQHGALSGHSVASIAATIEDLLAHGTLARRGNKYPTVWLPGKAVRETSTGDSDRERKGEHRRKPRSRYNAVVRELDNYRRRQARTLKWKPYMVFQRRAVVAIDQHRPATQDDLLQIPGLGPAKVERFGDDILDIVRRYGADV